jgi:PAS domain S-box-containing protein
MEGEGLGLDACQAPHDRLQGVLAFIERHFRERLTLQDVARSANFSPTYLTDLLRRQTGLSIHGWIIEHRVAEAKRLLVDTDMAVAVVAEHVGFGSASHFCRQFLKKTGSTPRAWRKIKWRFATVEADHNMLQSLVDNIPQLVWAKGGDGKLLYANRQWYAYTGQTVAESFGWGWLAAVHPSDVSRCLARWSAALTSGTPLEYRVRLRRAADLQYRWHLFRTSLNREDHGAARWIGTGTDVHDEVCIQ